MARKFIMKSTKKNFKRKWPGLLIFVLGLSLSYLVTPDKGFDYFNADALHSPIALSISEIYADYSFVSIFNQGFIYNGEYHNYLNWPPLGFKVLAEVFSVFSGDELLAGRLLSILVYGLTGLLFYQLILRFRYSHQIAFWSASIFLCLPLNLDSSYTIYCDIWVNFFWLSGMLILQSQYRGKYWFFSITCILGFFFHWFIILMLPIPFFYNYYKKSAKGWAHFSKIAGSILLSLFLALILIFNRFDSIPLIRAFKEHSSISFFNNLPGYSVYVLKYFSYLVFEFLVIGVLLLYGRFKFDFRIKDYLNVGSVRHTLPVLIYVTGALLLISLFFMQWVIVHKQGISFLSIPLAILVAVILSNFEFSGKHYLSRMGLFAAVFCVIQSFSFRAFLEWRHREVQTINESIISFVEEHQGDKSMKSGLFFDVDSDRASSVIRMMATAYLSDTYVFNLADFNLEFDTPDDYRQSIEKLSLLKLNDYNKEFSFLVSREEPVGLSVMDSVSIGGLNVYQINLVEKR